MRRGDPRIYILLCRIFFYINKNYQSSLNNEYKHRLSFVFLNWSLRCYHIINYVIYTKIQHFKTFLTKKTLNHDSNFLHCFQYRRIDIFYYPRYGWKGVDHILTLIMKTLFHSYVTFCLCTCIMLIFSNIYHGFAPHCWS